MHEELETMTLSEFVAQHEIWLEHKSVSHNPNMAGSEDMFNYFVTLRRPLDQAVTSMQVYFSKGKGLTDPPSTQEVLDTLASDAASYENAADVWDWLEELGWGDSAEHFWTYAIVANQATALKTFLGENAYETLLWDTERE